MIIFDTANSDYFRVFEFGDLYLTLSEPRSAERARGRVSPALIRFIEEIREVFDLIRDVRALDSNCE